MLSALFAMLPAPFLFKGELSVPLRGAAMAMAVLLDEAFAVLVSSPDYPDFEILPFRMFALCLCFSTLFLGRRRRFFGILATVLWVWVEFFSALSLSYGGLSMPIVPFFILAVAFLPLLLLNPYKKETRFLLAVIWVFAWTLFFRP